MRLDAHLLFSCLCIFARCTSMLVSAPLLGTVVPILVRILFSVVMTFALAPTLQPHIGAMPADLLGLVLAIAREAMIGLLIGAFLQLLVSSVQVAGAFMDVQMGTGSAQIFNPFLGATATPVSQFKVMLATILIFLLNGHRMMVQAFVRSYSMPGPRVGHLQDELIAFLGQIGLLSLQIAAPVAAVTIIIDAAAGIVNKAVPQTQPFLLSLPAKLAAGMVVLAVGLPALVASVQGGLEMTFDRLGHVLRGG
ncbi:MAG: flagellar biosynthetic protein FliR [Armatimonadetes bacterium]|nr:flagellar biosynthetic protein FliR [Armatimonadota bacterium]